MRNFLIIVLIIATCSSCKRWSHEYGNPKDTSSIAEYDYQIDPNKPVAPK